MSLDALYFADEKAQANLGAAHERRCVAPAVQLVFWRRPHNLSLVVMAYVLTTYDVTRAR